MAVNGLGRHGSAGKKPTRKTPMVPQRAENARTAAKLVPAIATQLRNNRK